MLSISRIDVPTYVLETLADIVETRSGLHFVDGRRSELASKAARLFAHSGCVTWETYLALLARPDGESLLQELIEALTVGETYFFRHRPYFNLIEKEVLPKLIARRRHVRQLRIWSAGCATGEEPYSLAILCRRLLPDPDEWQISILATDLNRSFLSRAEAGLYGEWSFRESDESFKASYFSQETSRYRIKPEFRKIVQFRYHNLVEGGYPSHETGMAQFDLILCRNVLIYFAPERIRQTVARIRDALAPGGWLILGPSDPLPGLLADFEMHATEDAVIYRLGERKLSPATMSGEKETPTQLPDGAAAPRSCTIVRTDSYESPPDPPAPSLETSSVGDWRHALQAASIEVSRGDLTAAERHCKEAIALAKRCPEPYYVLGLVRQAMGDDPGALAAFRQAGYVDRTFVPAHLAMATIHRRAARPDRERQALAVAERLLRDRPADEVLLVEERLTVGRLRDMLAQVRNQATPIGKD